MYVLRPPKWRRSWLVSGFSTRTGGVSTIFGGKDLNLGLVDADSKAAVEKNRRAFLRVVKAGKSHLVSMKQVHSGIVHVLNAPTNESLTGDGAITNVPGLLLSVKVADCVPVLVVDMRKKAVGAFHAGWRGTVKRIVENGVGRMRVEYDSAPRDLHAAIGPCIGQCCYAVGDEVIGEFRSQFAYADKLFREVFDDDPLKKKYPLLFMTQRAPGHGPVAAQTHLDLVEANRRQLIAAGVAEKNIWISGLCTSCNPDLLFSHRKESGFTGRMMGVIGVRSGASRHVGPRKD
ncbi:MAG: peptidoglycan editing factor PgeF [Acidobacteriales bacterium]|nr:peptidoglycan editing factor PgeF [Terriglobales bacterium]